MHYCVCAYWEDEWRVEGNVSIEGRAARLYVNMVAVIILGGTNSLMSKT